MAKIGAPIITHSGIAATAMNAGTAVSRNTTTGLITQVATAVQADGILTADVQANMPCDFYVPGSFAKARLGGVAVTDTTVPLKITTGGEFVPATTGDLCMALAKQTCATQGSLFEVQVWFMKY